MKPSIVKGQITKLNKRLEALKVGERIVIENLHNDVYHGSTLFEMQIFKNPSVLGTGTSYNEI